MHDLAVTAHHSDSVDGKIVVVGTKADHTPKKVKKWVVEYAQEKMAKAGDLEDSGSSWVKRQTSAALNKLM